MVEGAECESNNVPNIGSYLVRVEDELSKDADLHVVDYYL
jgi:hypothetical protein